LALAAAVFALAAPLAYMGQRLIEIARTGPIDPLLVLRDSHTSFYWRAAGAVWWAGIAAIVAFAASRGANADRAIRVLRLLAIPIALALALAAWRFP
jgi:hypothetical protein